MTGPFAVILAAGASRRFGSPKALAHFAGSTLLERAIERVRTVVDDRFVVVVGAHADTVLRMISIDPRHLCRHQDWAIGQSASLRCGLDATPEEAPALLVTLVDQPLVDAHDLQRLIDAWRREPDQPAAADYGPLLGAPCILPRSSFDTVRRLEGDRGAAAVLRASSKISRVSMPNAIHDVDTPQDLERLSRLPS